MMRSAGKVHGALALVGITFTVGCGTLRLGRVTEAVPPRITVIRAHEKTLDVVIVAPESTLVPDPYAHARLVELAPYEDYDPQGSPAGVWPDCTGSLEIPRFDGQRDRLYSKFQLIDPETGAGLGSPQYVTDTSDLPARDFVIPWPKSIKGVTCIVDIDDAVAAGTKYGDEGVLINVLIDWRNKTPEATWDVDGIPVPINMDYVRALDDKFRRMTEDGINFTIIPVNTMGLEKDPDDPMIHPDTDPAKAPMHHGAFNVVTERGLRCYRAAMEFLADRYTRPDGKYGLISGVVVGNEVQSHWVWHNMGEAPVEKVAREYVIALRVAWLAAQRAHKQLRIYASLEHNWTRAGLPFSPLKECRGDELLTLINDDARREGNFPWHLGFHPYPENLFEPRFWDDRRATMRLDTPKITFKNLEVLTAFMRQETFLYDGKPRRIILSEQGFHSPDGPEGERLQAAAYAYAYYKVSHMPEIDAFILHRHCDHPDEGGLRLGLLAFEPDDRGGWHAGRRKFIWDVYRLADTDQWEAAFEFAKPIIGIQSWDEALPRYVIDNTPAPELDRSNIVFDLYLSMNEAVTENCMAFRAEDVIRAAGWLSPSILQHPPSEGVGDAVFRIDLPALQENRKLRMRFGTMFSAKSVNGVRFSVLVNDSELWTALQTEEQEETHCLDLGPWAGQTINLTLRVDALGDAGYDWSHWVQPLIVVEDES